jgi:hypothetical protein
MERYEIEEIVGESTSSEEKRILILLKEILLELKASRDLMAEKIAKRK